MSWYLISKVCTNMMNMTNNTTKKIVYCLADISKLSEWQHDGYSNQPVVDKQMTKVDIK
jgi:type VI protein secretion system component VasA